MVFTGLFVEVVENMKYFCTDSSGVAVRVEPEPAANGEWGAAAARAAAAAMRCAEALAAYRRRRKHTVAL